jgi:hypothetical protein
MTLLARLCCASIAVVLLAPTAAQAAPSAAHNTSFWVNDGDLTAIAADSSRVYIGGEFNTVGPLTQRR